MDTHGGPGVALALALDRRRGVRARNTTTTVVSGDDERAPGLALGRRQLADGRRAVRAIPTRTCSTTSRMRRSPSRPWTRSSFAGQSAAAASAGRTANRSPHRAPGGTPQCPRRKKSRRTCPCPEARDERGVLARQAHPPQPRHLPGRHDPLQRTRPSSACAGDRARATCFRSMARWPAAEACGCFSSGRWSLDNLSPCIYRGTQNLAVLEHADGRGHDRLWQQRARTAAGAGAGLEQQVSHAQRGLRGRFQALLRDNKAGDAANPRPDDWHDHADLRRCVLPAGECQSGAARLAGMDLRHTQCAAESITQRRLRRDQP